MEEPQRQKLNSLGFKEMEEPTSTIRLEKNLHPKVNSNNMDVELEKNVDLEENSTKKNSIV